MLGMLEHLLPLLESWAVGSSLSAFNVAWKTAALLAVLQKKLF